MIIFIKITQFILSLSILVLVHEFGHFIFAKLFKTRVEKFYLFFNPWFSLFKYQRGETEYGIGWLPIGGYVKISGMIDESMDTKQLAEEPQPYEFRAKPAWQRLFIMIGGVLFNILFAFIIYIGVLYSWGEEYLPTQNAKYGIVCDTLALEIGLHNGDKILSVDNKYVENFKAIVPEIIFNESRSIQVDRNGQKVDISIPSDFIRKLIRNKSLFIDFGFPFIVDSFVENSTAKQAGLMLGDKILGINNQDFPFFSQYPIALANFKGQEVVLKIERQGQFIDIVSKVSAEGKIGVAPRIKDLFEYKKIEYSIFSAIPAGISKGYHELGNYVKQLKIVFQPKTEAYKSIGSVIAITNIFSPTWDWYSFWMLTALLSIMLGVVNILPIPALDGGHLLFLLYEMITRRKPSDKFLEYAQMTGMVLLIALMIFAVRNDVINYILK